MAKKRHLGKQKPRHIFILNPYAYARFTVCPRCGGKTKIRKRPFVIHVDPMQLMLFNMSGPYCPSCDLVILHQDKVERLLKMTLEQLDPAMIGNDYMVMGTTDAAFWRKYKEHGTWQDLLDNLHDFKEHRTITRAPMGWSPDDNPKKDKD